MSAPSHRHSPAPEGSGAAPVAGPTAPPQWACRRPTARGFTLIEVAVAITLLSLTMTFLYQILFNTIRSRDALREGLEAPKIDNAVLDTILKDFRFLYYRAGQFPADSGFWGRNTSVSQMDRVDFLTSRTSRVAELEEATQASGSSPLVEVGYAGKRSEPNEPGGRWFSLYRREAYFPDDDPTDGGMFDLIYDKVRRFDLRYFAAAEERAKDDSGLDEWDSKVLHKVPAAIELILEYDVREPLKNEPNAQGRVKRIILLNPSRSLPPDTGAMGMTPGMG